MSATDMKPKLLAIDQDPATLATVADVASPWFDTIRLRDSRRANEMLESHTDEIRVVVVEHAADSTSGVAFLESVRMTHPGVRRILTATFCDLGSIVGGLHSGAIQAMLHKPFRREELTALVRPNLAAMAAAMAPGCHSATA